MSVIWGSSDKGDFVKTLLWVVMVYEGVIGLTELANSAMSTSAGGASSALAAIENLPSVGSLVATSGAMTSGIVDLVVAGGIYYFGLHNR